MNEKLTFTSPNTKSLSALLALGRVIVLLKNLQSSEVAAFSSRAALPAICDGARPSSAGSPGAKTITATNWANCSASFKCIIRIGVVESSRKTPTLAAPELASILKSDSLRLRPLVYLVLPYMNDVTCVPACKLPSSPRHWILEEVVPLHARNFETNETEALSRDNRLLTFATDNDCLEFHRSPPCFACAAL